MTLFENIVNEGLKAEGMEPSDDMIITAVKKMLRMQIRYNDHYTTRVPNYERTKMVGTDKGKNTRYIIPVAFGLTKSGKKAIRAYQSAGSTRRGEPHWKLFLLDNIFSCSVGTKSFRKYGQQLINLGFNTTGDKGMTTLFAIAPIADSNVQVSNDSNDVKPVPVTQNDVNPSVTSQSPKSSSNNEFSPSKSADNTVDKSAENDYFTNKVFAPATKPIDKKDVLPTMNRQHTLRGLNGKFIKYPTNFASDKPQFDMNSDEWQKEYDRAANINSKPIDKQDVEGDKEENKDNKLTASYKDMMNRMDNLYKDDENED